jgi:hypothetical protein
MINKDTRFYFVAGCPGSAWSMISQRFKRAFKDQFDNSDETTERNYNLPEDHKSQYTVVADKWNASTHKGVYYGPYHEFGHDFDDLNKYKNTNDFYQECIKPYRDALAPNKLIKSHWFSYNLDWLWENCKGHHLMLVWRDPEQSRDWWYKMGGWDINYPIYTWYDNPDRMWEKIQEENKLIMDFATRKNIQWYDYDHDGKWLEQRFNIPPLSKPQAYPNFSDAPKVAIVEIPNE